MSNNIGNGRFGGPGGVGFGSAVTPIQGNQVPAQVRAPRLLDLVDRAAVSDGAHLSGIRPEDALAMLERKLSGPLSPMEITRELPTALGQLEHLLRANDPVFLSRVPEGPRQRLIALFDTMQRIQLWAAAQAQSAQPPPAQLQRVHGGTSPTPAPTALPQTLVNLPSSLAHSPQAADTLYDEQVTGVAGDATRRPNGVDYQCYAGNQESCGVRPVGTAGQAAVFTDTNGYKKGVDEDAVSARIVSASEDRSERFLGALGDQAGGEGKTKTEGAASAIVVKHLDAVTERLADASSAPTFETFKEEVNKGFAAADTEIKADHYGALSTGICGYSENGKFYGAVTGDSELVLFSPDGRVGGVLTINGLEQFFYGPLREKFQAANVPLNVKIEDLTTDQMAYLRQAAAHVFDGQRFLNHPQMTLAQVIENGGLEQSHLITTAVGYTQGPLQVVFCEWDLPPGWTVAGWSDGIGDANLNAQLRDVTGDPPQLWAEHNGTVTRREIGARIAQAGSAADAGATIVQYSNEKLEAGASKRDNRAFFVYKAPESPSPPQDPRLYW